MYNVTVYEVLRTYSQHVGAPRDVVSVLDEVVEEPALVRYLLLQRQPQQQTGT